jgi:hypothetical protein
MDHVRTSQEHIMSPLQTQPVNAIYRFARIS